VAAWWRDAYYLGTVDAVQEISASAAPKRITELTPRSDGEAEATEESTALVGVGVDSEKRLHLKGWVDIVFRDSIQPQAAHDGFVAHRDGASMSVPVALLRPIPCDEQSRESDKDASILRVTVGAKVMAPRLLYREEIDEPAWSCEVSERQQQAYSASEAGAEAHVEARDKLDVDAGVEAQVELDVDPTSDPLVLVPTTMIPLGDAIACDSNDQSKPYEASEPYEPGEQGEQGYAVPLESPADPLKIRRAAASPSPVWRPPGERYGITCVLSLEYILLHFPKKKSECIS